MTKPFLTTALRAQVLHILQEMESIFNSQEEENYKKNSLQKPTKTENMWPKERKSFKMQNEFSAVTTCVWWGSMSWQFHCLSLDSVGNFNARRELCN
jgi:hypothetical protein